MSDIIMHLPFSESDTDIQNYTASLLRLCSVNGLIPEKRQLEIRSELDSTFSETAEQYTKAESSTIPLKIAEQLYSSVLYQCDVYLLSLKSLSKAVEALLNISVKTIISSGRILILQMIEDSKAVFRKAYEKRLALPACEYRYAMDKAFDDFLRNYSARFDARNICTSIDYPLLNTAAYDMKSQGVMFILEYYTGIMLENEFCSYFSEKDIADTLVQYGKIYRCKYTDLLFNIAEVLLDNMLTAVLLNKPMFTLSISDKDIDKLYLQYGNYSENDILSAVKKAFQPYTEKLSPALSEYLKMHFEKFSCELCKGVLNNTLGNFLAVTTLTVN